MYFNLDHDHSFVADDTVQPYTKTPVSDLHINDIVRVYLPDVFPGDWYYVHGTVIDIKPFQRHGSAVVMTMKYVDWRGYHHVRCICDPDHMILKGTKRRDSLGKIVWE